MKEQVEGTHVFIPTGIVAGFMHLYEQETWSQVFVPAGIVTGWTHLKEQVA